MVQTIDSFSLSLYCLFFYTKTMASNILRRSLATSAASTVKIGLIPADGIGREGKIKAQLKLKTMEIWLNISRSL